MDQIVSGPEINKGNRKTHCSQASLDYLIFTSTLLILVLMCKAVQRSICIFRKQLSSFLCKSLRAEIQRDACFGRDLLAFESYHIYSQIQLMQFSSSVACRMQIVLIDVEVWFVRYKLFKMFLVKSLCLLLVISVLALIYF